MDKRIILSESEKNRILGMHKSAIKTETKIINEAVTPEQIQQLLVDKGFELGGSGSKGDGVDGKIGSKTLQAISDALAQFAKKPEGSNSAGTQGVAGIQGVAKTQNPVTFVPKVGMTGKGLYNDEADGAEFKVLDVKQYPCDITQVKFQRGKYQVFGYYKTSEGSTGPAADRKEIGFRRPNEAGTSADPCKDSEIFSENFGTVTFN